MSIFWTAPAALIGLAAVALPIAVHLLARQNIRTLPYPSLRFLRQTQLAALRRRVVEDAALLLCRVAIVAVAALALAGPVFQTAARQAEYAGRVSRAIVAREGASREAMARSAEGAFRSTIIARGTMADAFADATRWFDEQPPSAREIVILGALRRGALYDVDLSFVPRDIGIRFVPQTVDTPSTAVVPILSRRNGSLVVISREVRAGVDATQVTDGAVGTISPDLVRIIARAGDTALAEAALAAALDAGVPWSNFNQRIVVAWEGADTTALAPNTRVIPMPVPASTQSAADEVRERLLAASRPRFREPILISAEQLEAWTRSPGAPSPRAPIADEGDRRWLWSAVLALLIMEWRIRRATAAQPANQVGEARIA